MKTILNKIGHGKFSLRSVLERELDILRTIEFRIGSPTMLEFIETYKTELYHTNMALLKPKEIQEKLSSRILMLGKLACCSYDLMQLTPSLLAAAVLTLAVKLTSKS
jgi:hypothetical protein